MTTTKVPDHVYTTAADTLRQATNLPPDQAATHIVDAIAPLLIQHGRNLAARAVADHLGDLLDDDYDEDEVTELYNVARGADE